MYDRIERQLPQFVVESLSYLRIMEVIFDIDNDVANFNLPVFHLVCVDTKKKGEYRCEFELNIYNMKSIWKELASKNMI